MATERAAGLDCSMRCGAARSRRGDHEVVALPASSAWKAEALPLDDTRTIGSAYRYRTGPSTMAPCDASSTPRPNEDRLSSIRRHPSVVKDPTRFELVGSKGFEPNRPLGENGVTARYVSVPSPLLGSAYGTRTRSCAQAARRAASTPRPNRLPSLGCQRTHSRLS